MSWSLVDVRSSPDVSDPYGSTSYRRMSRTELVRVDEPQLVGGSGHDLVLVTTRVGGYTDGRRVYSPFKGGTGPGSFRVSLVL